MAEVPVFLSPQEASDISQAHSKPKPATFRRFGEKCAVFGISAHPEAAGLSALGLFALQHRGQQSTGIVSSDGEKIFSHKRLGMVEQVFDQRVFDLSTLRGHRTNAHNRYGTSYRQEEEDHSQPAMREGSEVSFSHNGNIPDTARLEEFLDSFGELNPNYNDSEMMQAAIAHYVDQGATLEDAVRDSIPLFTGAFSAIAMDKTSVVAFRDQNGIHPLSIGLLNGAYVFSSETCGLDIIGARYLRDVNPGEMVIADDSGLRSEAFAKGEQKIDIFEYIYFARPDSVLLGRTVAEVRRNLGIILAQEHPADADVVVHVPDSAESAAQGYSRETGIPHVQGLVKNRYVQRTFITPGSGQRADAVARKLNAVREFLHNKRVVVIDDSIVRATTIRAIVRKLRDAGAREVHTRITSPPIKYPDFYGIDTPLQRELVASSRSIEEIRRFIAADSLGYISLAGAIKAVGLPKDMLYTGQFSGEYPIDIGQKREGIVFES
ncbi:MAG: amidophosphoribosyltransferase [Patescibacteria group bacterium]